MTKAEAFKSQLEVIEKSRPVYKVNNFKVILRNDLSVEIQGNAALNFEDAKKLGEFLNDLFSEKSKEYDGPWPRA